MDYFECLDLRSYLLISCAASRITAYQLGNREWVLRTMWHGGAWFIWSMADARAFLQGLETKGACTNEKRRATHRERVTV